MGNQTSILNETTSEEKTTEGILPTTPIQAPKARIIELDPRSPSASIVRTPIQVGLDLNKAETPVIGEINTSVSEELDEKNRMISLDPRSPSIDFTRTPVLVEHQPVKLRNKNLESVRQQHLEFSPVKRDSKFAQGPILLDSTPIKKKNEPTQKRHSYVGLLETNLDYIETDLNKVPKKSILEKLADEKEALFATPKAKLDNLEDPRSPTIEFLRTPLVKLSEENEMEEVITEIQELKIPEENIDVCVEVESEKSTDESMEKPIKSVMLDEAVISPIKMTLEKICQIDNDIKDVIAIVQNPVVADDRNIMTEFDKKLTDLIYEDKDEFNTLPRTRKSKNFIRTPLGVCNTNTQPRTKSVSKLKVSDKPMNKNDFVISKIPVYKEKKVKRRMGIQCENTPPRSMNIKPLGQPKKAQWDSDKTLII